jgi:uncharacterized protein (TIGR00266 family)
MNTEIKYRPAYALAVVTLAPNESIRVDSGAMVSMSADLQIETKAQGGIMASLGRSLLGGESPPLPGDMFALEMRGETLLLQSGAFVACSESINLDTKWTGAKTFFAKEGPIMLRASGTGTLIFASYGAIHERHLNAGEKYKLDTGHLVAFNDGMGFEVQRVGGLKSTFFSGEGLVVQLSGPGRLLMQTRSEDAFLSWLIPHLPKSNSH